ncbi:unnamed protein product (macronuclear) [Paramecium tetraurelia]|uniref:Transmembrane protein n=1 Tax=Paramecium tetraurelia TaxID=5888 RepID=A0CZM5_PARTE|nr:uncharacterized protein GSPATT00011815001 [Paramecium tetraurelia]CAK76242.1 unnamed protein product [Paramecium tetraurelia]|eukprot:XP_001443639.1 hypothetical protein (macronuclear) [Paramecium tetraurelia strain d4-2]
MYNQQLVQNQKQVINKVITPEQLYPKPPILYKQSNLNQQLPQPGHEGNPQKQKFSQLTYQPYLPNPEIDKIINKYKSPEIQKPSQQNQVCFDNRFQDPNSNILQRPNTLKNEDDSDKLNLINNRNQNSNQLRKDQKLTASQTDYKNDRLFKLIIIGIIILQSLYIISLLNSN